LPLVAVACICEKVLIEEGGVMSAIRIVDRVQVHTTGVPEGMVVSVPLTALISLKSGDVKGKYELALKLSDPNGKTTPFPQTFPILLEGAEHGASIVVQMLLPSNGFGHYRLDVFLDSSLEPLTSIPFRLLSSQEQLRGTP